MKTMEHTQPNRQSTDPGSLVTTALCLYYVCVQYNTEQLPPDKHYT